MNIPVVVKVAYDRMRHTINNEEAHLSKEPVVPQHWDVIDEIVVACKGGANVPSQILVGLNERDCPSSVSRHV